MIEITFVEADGSERQVTADPGNSIMATATNSGIAGIIGECGGNAMCATCHVYIDDDRLPPLGEDEDALLEGAADERTSTSRLGCQIVLTKAMSGLRIQLPERQV